MNSSTALNPKTQNRVWGSTCGLALGDRQRAERPTAADPTFPAVWALMKIVREKDSSVDLISLLAEYTVFLLILVEVKGQQELLEIDEEWEEEVGWNGELKVEE